MAGSTCLCWSGAPDWNEITALATAVLALGVVIALFQLFDQRKASRVLETGVLIKEWKAQIISNLGDLLDKDPNEYAIDRARILRLYRHIRGLAKFRRFQKLDEMANDLIEEVAQLTERIEIYVRKGAADEGIVCEHLGYEVLSNYQVLRDVLQQRATDDDYSYEGFRDLSLRIQDYAMVFPSEADLRGALVWDQLPPLSYWGGDHSLGYDKSVWRKIQLEVALIRDSIIRQTTWAVDRWESTRPFYAG